MRSTQPFLAARLWAGQPSRPKSGRMCNEVIYLHIMILQYNTSPVLLKVPVAVPIARYGRGRLQHCTGWTCTCIRLSSTLSGDNIAATRRAWVRLDAHVSMQVVSWLRSTQQAMQWHPSAATAKSFFLTVVERHCATHGPMVHQPAYLTTISLEHVLVISQSLLVSVHSHGATSTQRRASPPII